MNIPKTSSGKTCDTPITLFTDAQISISATTPVEQFQPKARTEARVALHRNTNEIIKIIKKNYEILP